MDKHVSFEENIELDERIVDLASESEDRGALGMATADEATFIRRISLQQMKAQRDQERERAQLRREQTSTEESSSVSSSDSDLTDSSSASMQPGTVSVEWPQLTGSYSSYVPLALSNKSQGGQSLGLRSFPVSGMVYSPLIDND
jgi:hypothetical protein